MRRRRVLTTPRLSAAICILITFIWFGTHFATTLLQFRSSQHELEVGFIKDSFYAGLSTSLTGHAWFKFVFRPDAESPRRWMLDGSIHLIEDPGYSDQGIGGFGFLSTVEPGWTLRALMIPLWFCWAVTFTIPTIAGIVRQKRRRRKKDGLCAACGYDLRASTGRCPECGLAIEPLAPSPA